MSLCQLFLLWQLPHLLQVEAIELSNNVRTDVRALLRKHASNMGAGERESTVWLYCAPQWKQCTCRGRQRWGVEGKWKDLGVRAGPTMCNVDTLGDPAPGVDAKHCQCAVEVGSAAYATINPAMMLDVKARPEPILSCSEFERVKDDGAIGRKHWEAVEPFCSSSWKDSGPNVSAAGERTMDQVELSSLMDAWVDKRFERNYKKLFEHDGGWLDNAFVNYFAEFGNGKIARETEELIRSVHLFSTKPVVAINFGMTAPAEWTPERFPRLVLLHAAPLPSRHGKSFNYNKLRAMLLARVRTGVQLDSDQFVAPGVDAMFQSTAAEVTEAYPMPIMPAHYLQEKGPKEGGMWWPRFCDEKQNCVRQTMRWAHAHPTWTYWAAPFISRWLRRQFRDEQLPALLATNASFGKAFPSLRISDIPEDEDLLNLALWEEGATKQWCKFDVPDPSTFDDFLSISKTSSLAQLPVHEIGSDPRFHPAGVPEVFYTAHHAVDPDQSARIINQMSDRMKRDGNLPPPIVFMEKLYKDGRELRAAHPEVRCII